MPATENPGPMFSVMAAQEIPKPKNWQDFQRGCVVLFSAELKDPHAQEYGRHGQKQRGIDILGRRNGDPRHLVGIQCRRYLEPLKYAAMLKDCREALGIQAGLKEIIFATTAPSDTKATDAVLEVERLLRSEGHDLTVVLYSWSDLELKICQHPPALAFFYPAAVASTAQQTGKIDAADLSAALAEAMARFLPSAQASTPTDVAAPSDSNEDPALHAKIDLWRDLFRHKNGFLHAKEGLLELRAKEDLSAKPWASFRIETNLGSVAINLGQHEEAAAHFEKAYAIRPTDCNAIANLALARTIQGKYQEGIELAKVALNATPRSDQAVSFLLQAAARSGWQGDPESLIPADLKGTVHADMGLAEFLRKTGAPDWAERTRELARNHLELSEFKRLDALAILELALGPGAFFGRPGVVTRADLDRAASEMLAMANMCLNDGYADEHDLMAYVNNAAVLLRLTGRQTESEALLVRGLPKLPGHPHLRRLLALCQAAQDRFSEAEATLRDERDAESRLLFAELTSRHDTAEAIKIAEAIDPQDRDDLSELKWRILGDLGLRTGDNDRVEAAVAGLAGLPEGKLLSELLAVRRDARKGVDETQRHACLTALGASEFTLSSNLSRYLVADEMSNQDMPDEAARLLEPIVDLQVLSPITRLYLSCLAEARRDEAFRNSIANASGDVRADVEILWLQATHSWNIGDLREAGKAIDSLLRNHPDHAAARLLKVEILLRSDQVESVVKELERPIEKLAFTRLTDKFRVASLLGHFVPIERAVAYAYRLFLENREISQAWLCFHGLVLQEGVNLGESHGPWDLTVVGNDAAVDIEYGDGEKQFVIVEADGRLRRLDDESWEPDHPLVKAIAGLAVGASFTNPVNGKTGTIKGIRHKYVAKHHFVLANHEARFPSINAIRSIPVDVSTPEGLAPLLDELKAKHDWIEQEQDSYARGPWPLALLAHRTSCDTIDVAEGLASQDIRLKVAAGTQPERRNATASIVENGTSGCVLDLNAYWTCWRLGALGTVMELCGNVHLVQSTMDSLQSRRERISQSAQTGSKTARYDDGKMAITEITPQYVQGMLADVDRAIEWAKTHAVICPLIVPETAPQSLREFRRDSALEIFDSVILSMQKNLLLVTDDMPTRDFGRQLGLTRSSWLQPIFMVANNRGKLDFESYVKWSAHLIGAGHSYVSVSGHALVRAALIDAQAGECPGYFLKQTVKMLGGAAAEPESHVRVAVEFLHFLWIDGSALPYREAATGMLLDHLVRNRTRDYRRILLTVMWRMSHIPRMTSYLEAWLRGHFIDLSPRRAA